MALSVKTLNKMRHQDPYFRRRLLNSFFAKYTIFLVSHIYFEIPLLEYLNNSSRDEMYEKTAGCTWTDYKTNREIAKELCITPVLDTIQKKLDAKCQHNAL
jgi:hypothetical protein